MSEYRLTWVTEDLAVGYAPMSYDALDAIRAEGIDAIVNLCGEYCDLHEIEKKSGFEVYYLPIPDECVPDMAEMEKGLSWLDAAIYQGKKVLVHCRFGIGRTGTFVTAYLIRRGLGLKVALKKMKKTGAQPQTHSQWQMVKKYGKACGLLKIREPALESKNIVDLSRFFREYEALQKKVTDAIRTAADKAPPLPDGDPGKDCGYHDYFELSLIEAIYLFHTLNRKLSHDDRKTIVQRAISIREAAHRLKTAAPGDDPASSPDEDAALKKVYLDRKVKCPLHRASGCRVFDHRPIRCRCQGIDRHVIDIPMIEAALDRLSRDVFFAFSGQFPEGGALTFSLGDTVSGKFVQDYFYYLAAL